MDALELAKYSFCALTMTGLVIVGCVYVLLVL